MQKKIYIPWVLGLGLLMETLDSTVLNTALPEMARSFDANILTLKLAIISYIITLAAFLPIGGYLTDRFGTQRVFFVAVALFVASSFWCGMAHHLPELIIARLLQGVGGAMVTPVGRLILLKTFSRHEYIKAFTSLVLVGQMGVALGPTLGGALTTFLGWRWIFFINLPIGIVLLALIAQFIPNYREEVKYRLDIVGFLLFSTALGAITFGLAWMTEQAFEDDIFSIALTLVGVALLVAYAWHAKYCPRPLLNFSLVRLRTFRISLMGSFVSRIPLNAPFFLLTLLLQIEFGFSAFKSGLFLIPYGLSMALTKPFFGYILSHLGYRRSLILAPILLALTLLLFSQVTATTPAWMIFILVGFLGIFSSFQFSGMNSLAFSDVDPKEISNASIITGVFQQLAMSVAVCFSAGMLIMIGNYYHIAALNLKAFHTTFLILSGVMLLSIFVFRQLKPGDGAGMLL
ncbi:MAG: MFS transporter [Pseudomonadota bacterium]